MTEVGSTTAQQTAQRRSVVDEASRNAQTQTQATPDRTQAHTQATQARAQAQTQTQTQTQQANARDSFDRSASPSSSSSSSSSAAASLARNASVPDAGPKPSDGFLRELYGDQSNAPLGNTHSLDAQRTSSNEHLSNHAGHAHGGHEHGSHTHTHGSHTHGGHTHGGHSHGPPGQRPTQGGAIPPGSLAPSVQPARVSQGPNGQTVVDLPNGSDNVRVSQNPDGSVNVDQYAPGQPTDGSVPPAHRTTVTAEQARNLRINGNDGDDNIEVDDSVTHGLTIDGGAGNDRIIGGNGDDQLIGGDGNDHIEGRGGNDRIEGGAGDDQLYGGQGNDHIDGGDGNDWIHGGDGDDVLRGGNGNDQLFGGRGNDRLSGGDGDDALAGGEGDDIVDGGRGRDRVYVEGNDTVAQDRNDRVTRMRARGNVGHSIRPEGSARFQERMRDDLDALASTPQGRELMRKLDGTGRTTSIRERPHDARLRWDGDIPQRSSLGPDGRRGAGVNPEIEMGDTARDIPGAGRLTPSAIVLAHELAHAYDMATGRMNNTEVPNPDPTRTAPGVAAYELDAVGLPHRGGPRPRRPSENDVRRDLNMPRRRWY